MSNSSSRVSPRSIAFGMVALFLCGTLSASTSRLAQSQETQTNESSPPAESGENDSPMKVTEIEGITEYSLSNGVRLLLFPDPSKEVVTVNMTVFVGSRHEGYGEAGMAHLLEHMLFKGTPDHPNVPKVLQDRGARFNGTTWLDRTNYYETLPATGDNLEFAIRLEADRLVNSFIRGEDLESEMTVVRNEFERGENAPIRVLMQRMQAVAYEWHNYGQSTIGNRSDIERVPIVNLRRFYKKYYRPDNVMVIVAGKFDPSEAIDLVQNHFGKLSAPDTPIDETYTTEPAQDGERTVVLRRVGDVQWAGVGYHVPAGSHPEYAAVAALQAILGDEPSGRLYKAMVETELATNVYTMVNGLYEPGLFKAFAEVPKDHSIEEARLTLIETMEKSFAEAPVTEKELDRARQQILKRRELQATDSAQIAISLSDWAAQGDWRLYFLYRDSVEALTVEEVQRVANAYFRRDNRTVGLFIPSEEVERVTIPESPDLASRLDGYKGREVMQQGEAFDPSPEAIQERVVSGKLVGGMQYSLLPKKTRGESVNLALSLRFGSAETLKDKIGATELLAWLMSRGTESKDFEELQDEQTRLRANVSVDSTVGLWQMKVQTKREFVPEVIKMMGEIVRHPRLDADELEVIRRQVLTNLEQSRNEPNALAPRAVRRALSPYREDDIRYVRTIDEEIQMYQDVTLEQIQTLHREFLGNQGGELVAVGDFDPDELLSSFQEFLGDWTSDLPYVRVDQPANLDKDADLLTIETPDKTNAMLYANQQMELDDASPEYAALVLGNFILGSSGLSSRLGDRVRQQEGLSYGVGSGVSPRAKDGRVDLVVYAITNPANKQKLLDVIHEEIDRIRGDGVTTEELESAKTAYIQQQKVSRSRDNSLASTLMSNLFLQRSMEHQAKHEAQIQSATLQEVNAAIRKYILPEKMVFAVAGDFEGAE